MPLHPLRALLTSAEEGTRAWWGREYHWTLHDGVLHLTPGPCPADDTVRRTEELAADLAHVTGATIRQARAAIDAALHTPPTWETP